MIQVTFTFNTKEEAAAFLGTANAQASIQVPAKKPGRPKKEEAVASTENVQVTKARSVEDVREALQKVSSKLGLNKASELIMGFGYTRISDIPVEKYGEFIAACEEKVA